MVVFLKKYQNIQKYQLPFLAESDCYHERRHELADLKIGMFDMIEFNLDLIFPFHIVFVRIKNCKKQVENIVTYITNKYISK